MKPLVAKFAYAVAVLLICGYGFMALRGPGGIPGWLDKQRQIHELQKRNAALSQEIAQKRAHIQRLQQSQAEQERVVRDRLKLVKPGEKVFILQDQDKK
jgi:cell division protein FtsB